jgi:hypothetical protein
MGDFIHFDKMPSHVTDGGDANDAKHRKTQIR